MKEIFPYLKPLLPRMGQGLVIKIVGTLMDLLLPWILSYMIDYIVPQKDMGRIYLWGGVMLVCAVIAVVGNIVANRMASRVARDTTRQIRHDLFTKVSSLSSRQIDHYTIPSLEARLTTDTYNVNQVVGMIQRLGVRAPILLLGGVVVTLTLEPVLTLVMVSTLPLILLLVWLVTRKGLPLFSHLQQGVDTLVRTVRENMTGIRVVKALSKGEESKVHFAAVNAEVARRERKANVVMNITNPIMNLLLNTGLTLVVLVGAFRINAGQTQPGAIIAFLSYFTIILNAMLSITRLFVMYSRGSASAQRIGEVLHTPRDLQVVPCPRKEEPYHIVFADVCFSYTGKEADLAHISFALLPGETLGVIGGTGCGKSTLAALLLRQYDVDSGSIRIGGREIRSIPPEELHTMFGVTFQNDVLFAQTIEENIDFGRGLPHAEIVRAARDAQALDFIEALPDGFQHMLTPKGTNLSGGQKQRLLVARALAGKPQVLILDDASSALDYRTDASLRQALAARASGSTTVLIAQRVSSIRHADHILVLEKGRTIGYGTHTELLQGCPLYREIAESQMGGDAL